MKHLCILTLAALTFDLAWGQAFKYQYLPEDIANPQSNPKACGLGEKSGYVCDPNNILTRHQLETLDWFLRGIAEVNDNDKCPCSQYHCENKRGPKFYKVAIALVPSLRIPLNTDGRQVDVLAQAQTFAYRLESKLWDMGSCEEDIVILYSRDDQALVTMTGKVAGQRLDPFSRQVIHSIVGQHFADGRINEGLLRMVHEISLVLNGNSYKNYLGHTGAAHHITSSPLLFLLLALGSCWLVRSLFSL